jgi:cysteinyl-tRNA synthetase
MPYLRVLSSYRDGIRQLAISKGDGAAKEILALCDKLRDSDLVPLGVALDDQEGGSYLDSDRVRLNMRFSKMAKRW